MHEVVQLRGRIVKLEHLLRCVCDNVYPALIKEIKKEIGYVESDSVAPTEDSDDGPSVA